MDTVHLTRSNGWWPFFGPGKRACTNEPTDLWARGDLSLMHRPAVAVVGSRASTPYGDHCSGQIGSALARHDVVTVSGLAFGIDAAAHRGALAGDGPTIAVLAGGVDRCYPSAHLDLYQSIIDKGGLILSEQAPGETPTRQRFLARNRLIVALSGATVVVEASRISGSLNTARHALEMSRSLWAVPGPVTSATSTGTNELLGKGARPLTDPGDVAELIAPLT